MDDAAGVALPELSDDEEAVLELALDSLDSLDDAADEPDDDDVVDAFESVR
ncbi:MAG: hypothetical protein ACTHJJ_02580 [Intrasporangium sp.]|uniref:hypothetical protein n=1 Tax=Intrasporangium sp. TaxID=1925024 RepID=UPI003F7FA749